MMHLKSSLRNIRRAPFQAVAAISVLSLTFFVATILAIVVFASNQLVRHFETRPQVIAFLEPEATVEQIDALREELSRDSRIRNVTYVSKEEALQIYRDLTSDNPLLGELVSPSSFPASIEFSLVDIEFANNVIEEVRQDPIVDDKVGFTATVGSEEPGDIIQRLRDISFWTRVSGVVLISVLAVNSFLVLLVIIGFRVTMKREEIESLILMGATPWFVRAPVIYEAINYGVIGAISGWLLGTVVLLYATPSINQYLGQFEIFPSDSISFFSLLGVILAGELLAALLISLLGSFIALSRSLKLTRK